MSRNPCSNPPRGGLRSQLRPATDVDEGARQGQVGRRHMGSGWGAKLQAVLKHGAARAARRKRVRVASEPSRVVHGVTCPQWLTSLTGESPTPSRSPLRVTRAHKSYERASIMRRRNRALLARLLGDGSFSGVVPAQRHQRRIRRNPSRRRESMGAVGPQTANRSYRRPSHLGQECGGKETLSGFPCTATDVRSFQGVQSEDRWCQRPRHIR